MLGAPELRWWSALANLWIWFLIWFDYNSDTCLRSAIVIRTEENCWLLYFIVFVLCFLVFILLFLCFTSLCCRFLAAFIIFYYALSVYYVVLPYGVIKNDDDDDDIWSWVFPVTWRCRRRQELRELARGPNKLLLTVDDMVFVTTTHSFAGSHGVSRPLRNNNNNNNNNWK